MNKLTTLLILSAFFFSCDNSNDEETIDTKVSIYPSIISLDSYLPVDTVVTITCKTDWEIEKAPSWCAFRETKGKGDNRIALHIPKNESSDRRYATIKINAAELIIDQQGDVINDGDKVGTFLLNESNLTVIEYRIKGNLETPNDKYTLIGGGVLNNDLSFYFQNKQYVDYYLGTSLKVQHKISNTYYSETFSFKLMYSGKQDRYGYGYIQSNLAQTVILNLNGLTPETNNGYTSTLSNGKITIVFKDCKFISETNRNTYYVVNGSLVFDFS